MALTDLTSRDAVLAAIREFDERGREAFLAAHGFGPARNYFLEYGGVRYDSKAIAGVAHGVQHPRLGPLRAADFSGGEATVKKVLEALGFVVIRLDRRETRIWALCANPARYRIREAVEHLEVDHWTIRGADVHNGDYVAIWRTRDTDGHRGIIALGQVIGEPTIRSDLHNPFWISADDARAELPRVPVRYQRLSTPLWVDDTDVGQFIGSLSVAKARGGTVFRLTDKQWARLVNLAGGFIIDDPIVAEVGEAARGSGPRGTGQGFGLSVAERAAVEAHAMNLAKKHYKASWRSVEDVSEKCSFDLLCRSATSELRVEVKGTTSAGDQIVLTKREVEEANLPGYALFVVSDIALIRTGESACATGGQCRVISRWRQNKHNLTPIAYSVTLNWSEGKIVELKVTPMSGVAMRREPS
jgi:hypothetical protein